MLFAQCEELLPGGYETVSCMGNFDDSALASLMAEISDPALHKTVLGLSLAAARADGHLADGEAIVVEAARHHWQLLVVEESRLPAARRRKSDRIHLCAFSGAPQPPLAAPAGDAARGAS